MKNSIFQPLRDAVHYWRWQATDIEGTFEMGDNPYHPGEKLIIDSPTAGIFQGEILWLDDDGWLHFIALSVGSSNSLQNARIEGVSSGASAILPKGTQPTTFLSPGSNKYLRIWEEESGSTGLRLSWTQDLTSIDGISPDGTDTHLRIGRWNHMEAELDLANNTYRTWINSELHISLDISDVIRDDIDLSPTIALIGFNGKNQAYQRTRIW